MPEAIKIMTKCKLGTLIALNSKQQLSGVLSDGDVRKHIQRKYKKNES